MVPLSLRMFSFIVCFIYTLVVGPGITANIEMNTYTVRVMNKLLTVMPSAGLVVGGESQSSEQKHRDHQTFDPALLTPEKEVP